MTVKEFLENKNSVENLEIHNYVSYKTKLAYARKITDMTTHEITKSGINTSKLSMNSTFRTLLCKMYLIDMYTDLEIDTKNLIDDYDLLAANNLDIEILSAIPERELKDFSVMVEQHVQDVYDNEYNIQSYLYSLTERLVAIAGISLKPAFESLIREFNSSDNTDNIS